MDHAAHARSLPEPSRTPTPARSRAPAGRHADPPAITLDPGPAPDLGPAPGPAPAEPRSAAEAALCRAATPEAHDAVRIDLVWRDPVTGLDLQLDLEGPPALVDRLIAEGFRSPAGGGDVEAA